MDLLVLAVSLAMILAAATLFTNGVEWLGVRWNVSQGAVGSVLAAVGTALPETIVPIVAILGRGERHGEEIGVGAILGAPFMLGTLAFLVTGLAVVYYHRRRRRSLLIVVDRSVIRRDLRFFLIAYALAIVSGFLPSRTARFVMAALLLGAYVLYVYLTMAEEAEEGGMGSLGPLYLARRHRCPPVALVGLQVLTAVAIMVAGAHLFVGVIERTALAVGLSPFLVSAVVAPIATELPEKFNSVVWVGQGKDTLALGNITGAMVFQSSVIPALGMLLTPWRLGSVEVFTAVLTVASALVVYLVLVFQRHLRPQYLVSGGIFYVLYLALVL